MKRLQRALLVASLCGLSYAYGWLANPPQDDDRIVLKVLPRPVEAPNSPRPAPAPTDVRMLLQTQDGTVICAHWPDDEDVWFNAAFKAANERGEAVVVTQAGKFILLANPRK